MKTRILLLTAFTTLLAWLGTPTAHAASLVCEWKFEDNLNDSSGNGNDGTATGSPTYVPGRFGQAISLAPPDMVQKLGANNLPLAGLSSWSMNIWVNLATEPVSLCYIAGFGAVNGESARRARAYLSFTGAANNNIYFWGNGPGDLASPLRYPTGRWAMLTITHDGANSNTVILLDAVPIASGARGLLDVTVPDISLAPQSLWGNEFAGSFDEFTIWDGVLSEAEIVTLFGVTGITFNGQPQSVTRYEGEPAQLSAAVVGIPPLRYQWYHDGVAVPDATNRMLFFTKLKPADAGEYALEVSNDTESATSDPATVSVTPVPGITTALTGYWNFDEGSGDVLVDNSGMGNDGTLFNYPEGDSEWVPGQIEGALSFGGPTVSNYVLVPNYPKPFDTMTIALWVRANSPTWASFVKNWGGSTSGQFHFGLNAADGRMSNYQTESDLGQFNAIEPVVFPTNAWQHVAFVSDGFTMRMYRNGVQVASAAYDGTILPAPIMTSLAIGCKTDNSGTAPDPGSPGFWNGLMDDFGLWQRGLCPEEILAIYSAGLSGHPLTDVVVGAIAPTITTPPANQTVTEGGVATFSVVAAGTAPLAYQWWRNGAPLDHATNDTLVLANICAPDAGDITVVVCNVAGCVTSTPPALLTVTPLPTTPITDGLVGYWKFDETGGLTAEDSVGGNDGMLFNYADDNSQWIPGRIGGALNFGGPITTNYVIAPNYPKPDSDMTIALWVWVNQRNTWASFVKNWGDSTAGQFHFGLNNNDGDMSNYLIESDGGQVLARENSLFPLGSWQHVAFVCDGTLMRLYRNGVQVGSAPYDGSIRPNPVMSSLAFGCKTDNSGTTVSPGAPGLLDGKLDDAGLWLRGLSAVEIRAIYLAGNEGRPLTDASVLPSLNIVRTGGDVTISWPAAPAGGCFFLEDASIITAPLWNPTGPATLTDERYHVTVPAGPGNKFFRLRKQ